MADRPRCSRAGAALACRREPPPLSRWFLGTRSSSRKFIEGLADRCAADPSSPLPRPSSMQSARPTEPTSKQASARLMTRSRRLAVHRGSCCDRSYPIFIGKFCSSVARLLCSSNIMRPLCADVAPEINEISRATVTDNCSQSPFSAECVVLPASDRESSSADCLQSPRELERNRAVPRKPDSSINANHIRGESTD